MLVEKNDQLLRAILDITSETLAITRESAHAHLESQERLQAVSTHMNTGFDGLLKTTGTILGITQRLENYREGRYMALLDEWLVFWTFFLVHPFAPRTSELFGSVMIYVLAMNRMRQVVPVYPTLYCYFTSPYKAIFLLYWFTNEFILHPQTFESQPFQFPTFDVLQFQRYEPAIVLISVARHLVVSTSKIFYALLLVGVSGQLHRYLRLELYMLRCALYGVWYLISFLLEGTIPRLCDIQFTIPFYSVIRPFYYVC